MSAPALLLALAASIYAPDPVELTPTLPQQLAAARAAGFAVKGAAIVDDCGDRIEQMHYGQTDLDGDKVPELIVTAYSPCYGNGGNLFSILRKTPAGWQAVGSGNGTAAVLKRVHGGWHDIQIGQPGLNEMPVLVWKGRRYEQ